MVNRLKSLKPRGRFDFKKDSLRDLENYIAQQTDTDKVETAICLESVLYTCYQTMGGLVHNELTRKECQRFEQRMQYHQAELRAIFPLSPGSETAIICKVYECLMQLKPPYLFLRAITSLAMSLTAYKIKIYKYLSRTQQKHHKLLNGLFQNSLEEMNFLRQEAKCYQNKSENTHFKDFLENVIYYLYCV